MAEIIRTSPWGGVVLRVGGLAVALLFFAWIGMTYGASPVARADPPPTALSEAGTPAASLQAMPATPLPAPPTTTPSGAGGRPGRATPEDPVFVNHAGADELRRLPGVGAKRAEAILALRQRVGRFQRVEDLMRVKGIGRATIRRWRPLVRLEERPAPSDAGRGP